jgi:hypothetical protein
MIVRLMGEGQFEMDSKHLDELNKIDNRVVEIVTRGDEEKFRAEYQKLASCVRKNGKLLPNNIIKESDLIIPPADLTLEEARRIFSGAGIIKD